MYKYVYTHSFVTRPLHAIIQCMTFDPPKRERYSLDQRSFVKLLHGRRDEPGNEAMHIYIYLLHIHARTVCVYVHVYMYMYVHALYMYVHIHVNESRRCIYTKDKTYMYCTVAYVEKHSNMYIVFMYMYMYIHVCLYISLVPRPSAPSALLTFELACNQKSGRGSKVKH